MEIPEIQNFEDVLTDILPNKKLVTTQKILLTAPGENYGSLILAIKIILENEEISSVAKLLPANEFMEKFMNAPFTFRNELAFYQTIVPTLRNFLDQRGCVKTLDFLPKFYGGRLNLNSSSTLDENAILLLENLKTENYLLLDATVGFDLNTTKLVLAKMAELHGTVMALKENCPDVFEEKLNPYFEEFKIFQMGENEDFMASQVIVDAVINMVENDELCVLYLEKIKTMIKNCVENLKLPKNSHDFTQDVFATLIHIDLWVNNIMVKVEKNKVSDVKFIDWQLYEHSSATKDILFFLFTSASDSVLKQHFDDLLLFYYSHLIGVLEELKCPVEKFSFRAFQEEMKRVSIQVTYFYMMTMIPSIFPTEGHVWEVSELNKQRLLDQVQVSSELCKNRICLITRQFIKKGWL